MDMPSPGELHQAIDVLVGHWTGDETMHPSPWSAEGDGAKA